LHNLFGVYLVFAFLFLEFASAATSIEASKEKLDHRNHKLAGVRTENVNQERQTESLADLLVPLGGEVLVLSIKDGNKAKERSIESVKINE